MAVLPEPFVTRLEEILPTDSLKACLDSFSVIKPTTFRVNTLKTTEARLCRELESDGFQLVRVSWGKGVFTVAPERRRRLTESPAFEEGRIYIQGLSSMLAPWVLDPRPGETVLDLAAAPGGKTLLMAAMMENRGQLSAVESVKGRFFRLRSNLERHGVTMVKTYLMDGRAVGSKVPERFDRVLLDAPCSSEARFNTREPSSWSHWSLKKIKESARKQRRLLDSAIRSLKPGGELLYCTCSFAPEENEMIVDAQLRRYGAGLSVQPVALPLDHCQNGLVHWRGKSLHGDLVKAVRVLPTPELDGFFLCKLKKNG
ncbi:MAG: RsmB/NOP family class I SAM-dependent RNA methyltransferase [Gammaproteobacteria bacterium]|nr:RsmB/NOP family class I SAM-dependent RNA methyltransferase [Gammaproteobacteria bacterium]